LAAVWKLNSWFTHLFSDPGLVVETRTKKTHGR